MKFFPRKFFKKTDDKKIINCIKEAEKQTSGEIRVHFQKKLKVDILEEAVNTFYRLKMDETKDKNGVLFFFVMKKKKFAIIGDKGINDVVPDDFWENIKIALTEDFSNGHKTSGICNAIKMAGDKLKEFFPYDSVNDVNELPDEISYS
ncbi:MAG: TPM domain-containing protein [Saprospiraceae bacterium]